MTSFKESDSNDVGQKWRRDNKLVRDPSLLQFSLENKLSQRALDFASLLFQDTAKRKIEVEDEVFDPSTEMQMGSEGDTPDLPVNESPSEADSNIEVADIIAEDEKDTSPSEDSTDQSSPETDTGASDSDVTPREPMFSREDVDRAQESARLAGIDEGMKRGLDQGRIEGALEAEKKLKEPIEKSTKDLEHFLVSLKNSIEDHEYFFLPLKRLAVHVAIEIVRGELQISDDAITRLLKGCLQDIATQEGYKIKLVANSDDIKALQDGAGKYLLDGVDVEEDSHLSRGSIKLSVNESLVEDLIENRIKELAVELLGKDIKRSETVIRSSEKGHLDSYIDDKNTSKNNDDTILENEIKDNENMILKGNEGDGTKDTNDGLIPSNDGNANINAEYHKADRVLNDSNADNIDSDETIVTPKEVGSSENLTPSPSDDVGPKESSVNPDEGESPQDNDVPEDHDVPQDIDEES